MLPGVDDGARSLEEATDMANIAADQGTATVIVTPHQLGNYSANSGDRIRQLAAAFQAHLDAAQIPLRIQPGADVRIDDTMLSGLVDGSVLSLGDLRKHVLLELPHELYFPVGPVLAELRSIGMDGILSHPERNHGILQQPDLVPQLIAEGCFMQVTSASLVGTFGPRCQQFAEWMVSNGYVHFLATDAHGAQSRRPLMERAFRRTAELTDMAMAEAICCIHPNAIAKGHQFSIPRPTTRLVGLRSKPRSWLGRRKSA